MPTKSIRLVEFPSAADTAAGTWVAESEIRSDRRPDRRPQARLHRLRRGRRRRRERRDWSISASMAKTFRSSGPKVAGIVYFHRPDNAELARAECVVRGCRRLAAQGQERDARRRRLKIVTKFGGTLAPSARSLKLLDFSAGRMLLSGRPPRRQRMDAAGRFRQAGQSLAKFYRPRQDRCLDGRPLRLGGKIYPKGLAIPSRTSLTYKITGKGKRLQGAGRHRRQRPRGAAASTWSSAATARRSTTARSSAAKTPVDLDLDVSA